MFVRRGRGQGSSPLTRGKLPDLLIHFHVWGLIPAHAGKTKAKVGVSLQVVAHPRSRGENSRSSRTFVSWLGSSPLTRGKPSDTQGPRRRGGLIPAHAGKTPCRRAPCHGGRAHPRSRGENVILPLMMLAEWGSSPLTRGKLSRRVTFPLTVGLIPAHAGKTPWTPTDSSPPSAHPRSRGENLVRVGT